ncbi:MAG: lipid A export permease/ATP-binding protein MsbA [Desulfobacterales bacterium S3730MH5]|nr:MAG: lipid A export permease/ATP-binding protein MsbA [Desulfobacterales bacterium S3730MH5]OEU84357.1 MAG: lipid A export permease/ATP-binding protein MsbA [Desulfobacterales bacterium S5133MH4]
MTKSNGADLQKIYWRLIALVKSQWRCLFFAMLCMLVVAALTAATAYLVKPVLDEIFVKKDKMMLMLLPIAIIMLYIFRGAAFFGQAYLMNYVGHSIIKRLRDELYSHIQMLSLSFFNKHETGMLMARIVNDVNVVKAMVSNAVTGVLRDFFTIIGLLFVIFYRDWMLALIAVTILPAAVIPIVKFGRRMRRFSTRCQEAMADMNSILHETFTGTRIVKAFGMEPYENKRFFEKTLRLFKYEMKAVKVRAMSSPIMELLGGIGITLIVWYGGAKVIDGTSTPGTFFSFMVALIMLYAPIKKICALNNVIQEGLAAAVRIYHILDTVSEIKERQDAAVLDGRHHSVTFRNVSFKYEHRMVLKNIDLSVKSGEIIALVGISGGGKTTLVNLIPRFYDVTEGAILIDGQDIRDVTIASLRSQIGVVTQDSILFNDTIRNNIAYGNSNACEPEIIRAAKAGYAYDFIQGFADKFDTVVGEKGVRLSGGEKQRICIARALLKNAPILILDEATSSLDTESELAVQRALENLMKGRTTFVIAHRLSTIRDADRIIVIANGKIVEEGKHEQLLARNGEYCKLHEMQFENNKQKLQSRDVKLHESQQYC